MTSSPVLSHRFQRSESEILLSQKRKPGDSNGKFREPARHSRNHDLMPNKNSVQLNLPATFFMHLNAWAANNTLSQLIRTHKGRKRRRCLRIFFPRIFCLDISQIRTFSVGHLHGVISSCRPAKENRVSSKEESVTPVTKVVCVSD